MKRQQRGLANKKTAICKQEKAKRKALCYGCLKLTKWDDNIVVDERRD